MSGLKRKLEFDRLPGKRGVLVRFDGLNYPDAHINWQNEIDFNGTRRFYAEEIKQIADFMEKNKRS